MTAINTVPGFQMSLEKPGDPEQKDQGVTGSTRCDPPLSEWGCAFPVFLSLGFIVPLYFLGFLYLSRILQIKGAFLH